MWGDVGRCGERWRERLRDAGALHLEALDRPVPYDQASSRTHCHGAVPGACSLEARSARRSPDEMAETNPLVRMSSRTIRVMSHSSRRVDTCTTAGASTRRLSTRRLLARVHLPPPPPPSLPRLAFDSSCVARRRSSAHSFLKRSYHISYYSHVAQLLEEVSYYSHVAQPLDEVLFRVESRGSFHTHLTSRPAQRLARDTGRYGEIRGDLGRSGSLEARLEEEREQLPGQLEPLVAVVVHVVHAGGVVLRLHNAPRTGQGRVADMSVLRRRGAAPRSSGAASARRTPSSAKSCSRPPRHFLDTSETLPDIFGQNLSSTTGTCASSTCASSSRVSCEQQEVSGECLGSV